MRINTHHSSSYSCHCFRFLVIFIFSRIDTQFLGKTIAMKVKIVLADDHHINRNAMAQILALNDNYEVCIGVGNGEETMLAVKTYRPDILLLDLQMPIMDGYAVLKELAKNRDKVRVIVFSAFDDAENITKSIKLGARGFLSKCATIGEEEVAIETVLRDEFYLNKKAAKTFFVELNHFRDLKPLYNNLTHHFDVHEMQVVYFHTCQMTSAEIGMEMSLSKRTIEGIKQRMIRRLRVENFVSVVIYCYQNGLIDLKDIPIRLRSDN